MLNALVLAAAVAFTPNMALQHARAIIESALAQGGAAQFRHMELRASGERMAFCGEVNTRDADGVLSGWKQVMILVSPNPNLRAVVVGHGRDQREMIRSQCGAGVLLNHRDYSAALSVF